MSYFATVIYRTEGNFPAVHFNLDGTAVVIDAWMVTIRGVPKHSETVARRAIDIARQAVKGADARGTSRHLHVNYELKEPTP